MTKLDLSNRFDLDQYSPENWQQLLEHIRQLSGNLAINMIIWKQSDRSQELIDLLLTKDIKMISVLCKKAPDGHLITLGSLGKHVTQQRAPRSFHQFLSFLQKTKNTLTALEFKNQYFDELSIPAIKFLKGIFKQLQITSLKIDSCRLGVASQPSKKELEKPDVRAHLISLFSALPFLTELYLPQNQLYLWSKNNLDMLRKNIKHLDYRLDFMSALPENNPSLARACTIYLSDEGQYVVRFQHKILQGNLDEDCKQLDHKIKLADFKEKIIVKLSKLHHIQTRFIEVLDFSSNNLFDHPYQIEFFNQLIKDHPCLTDINLKINRLDTKLYAIEPNSRYTDKQLELEKKMATAFFNGLKHMPIGTHFNMEHGQSSEVIPQIKSHHFIWKGLSNKAEVVKHFYLIAKVLHLLLTENFGESHTHAIFQKNDTFSRSDNPQLSSEARKIPRNIGFPLEIIYHILDFLATIHQRQYIVQNFEWLKNKRDGITLFDTNTARNENVKVDGLPVNDADCNDLIRTHL